MTRLEPHERKPKPRAGKLSPRLPGKAGATVSVCIHLMFAVDYSTNVLNLEEVAALWGGIHDLAKANLAALSAIPIVSFQFL